MQSVQYRLNSKNNKYLNFNNLLQNKSSDLYGKPEIRSKLVPRGDTLNQ